MTSVFNKWWFLIFILLYILLSFIINESATFTVEEFNCKSGICIGGLPTTAVIILNKNLTGTLVVSSKAFPKEKIEFPFFNQTKFDLSFETKEKLKPDDYSINFKVNQSLWNLMFDPLRYIEYSVIGKKEIKTFRYPDVRVYIVGELLRDNGVYYEQITLKNKDEKNWVCKLRLSVSRGSEILHTDFSRISLEGHRDIFESIPKVISRGGDTYGKDDVMITSSTCKDRMAIDIVPVCIFEGKEFEIADENKYYKKEFELKNNPC